MVLITIFNMLPLQPIVYSHEVSEEVYLKDLLPNYINSVKIYLNGGDTIEHMDNINVPVFAQAKVEYTKQLIDILYNHIFDGFSSIYTESKKIYLTKTGVPILNIFRKLLKTFKSPDY